MPETYRGGCHCGAVQYEFTTDLSGAMECNCSICAKRGALWAFAKPDQVKIVKGDTVLSDYQFGKKRIHHLFCENCGVGSFSTGNNLFLVITVAAFGVIGYVFKKLDIPIAPMAFTLILGPLTENSLRQALSMSGGELSILFRGYTSTGLLILAVIALAYPMITALRNRAH